MAAGARDSGIYTAEGMTAGSLAGSLATKRAAEHADFLKKKDALTVKGPIVVDDKFVSSPATAADSIFRAATVGLVTVENFRRAREQADAISKGTAAAETAAAVIRRPTGDVGAKRKRPTLSFADDEAEDEAAPSRPTRAPAPAESEAPGAASNAAGGNDAASALSSREGGIAAAPAATAGSKITKNPTVSTTFLPDADRERREAELRASLAREWVIEQERIRKEKIEIVFSWWDGTGHRRTITVPKGTTIGKFLEWVRTDLLGEFPELRNTSADSLLYVKEDLIIPHNYSFYDLIVSKARGKSGPLFHFDVRDDIRMTMDTRVEKDESHPGKIVERRWYERSKHIFPASRWEVYDPATKYDEYSTHGREVQGTK